MTYRISIGEQTFEIEIGGIAGQTAQVRVDGVAYDVRIEDRPTTAAVDQTAAAPVSRAAISTPPAAAPAAAGAGTLQAPIPGTIMAILVEVGDAVGAGQVVAIMEAMKMENNLVSRVAGTVREIRVQKGAEVATGDVVMVIG
jgi:biotin carboxyl carrier protein